MKKPVAVRVLALTAVALSLVTQACSSERPSDAAEQTAVQSAALVAGGWHTEGNAIHDPAGNVFRIEAINWYGFETRDMVAHGLWAKSYELILDDVKAMGFNTVRIPYSSQMWESNPSVKSNSVSGCGSDCQGLTVRDVLAKIINYAGSIDLYVILDHHRSSAGNSAEGNGLWFTSAYPESTWIADWLEIQRWTHGVPVPGDIQPIQVNYLASNGFPVVLGFDLHNEPHTPARKKYVEGATWGDGGANDWRRAAQEAGSALMAQASSADPPWDYPLIFVEGISRYPLENTNPADDLTYDTWWGGNLRGAAQYPVEFTDSTMGVPVADKLVYSPHDYGPDEYAQSWFNSGTSLSSLVSDVWGPNWGYLAATHPIFIGEFGTSEAGAVDTGVGSQGQWFQALVQHITESSYSWGYWALNGNDSYGVLDRAWDYAGADARLQTLCSIESTPPSYCGQPDPDPDPECTLPSDCADDGLFCNGTDECLAGQCVSSGSPCAQGQSCDEATDTCSSCGGNKASCNTGADCCSGNCSGKVCRGT